MSSFSPCPSCGEKDRGSNDRRGPVGVARDQRGWKCQRCQEKGDAVDLVSWVKYGHRSDDLNGAQWTEIRAWFAERGWATATGDRPHVSSSQAMADALIAAGSTRRPRSEPEPEPSGPSTGPFGWHEGRAEKCAERLWTEEGAVVLEYLRTERKFTESTIRDWGLGAALLKGEPWLTIPLRDVSERTVNIRFRSVPPATKTYRVCPNRPLPLFGADRLGMDLAGRVVVTEGELDVIAMYEYGFTVSVVSGTAGAGAWKDAWLDLLEPYDALVLAYDDDEAGDAGAENFAQKMGKDRCARAVLPHNDAGECLKQGVSRESVDRCLEMAQPMFGVEIRQLHEYQGPIERLINNPNELVGLPTQSALLNRILGGHRPGVTIISGDTGKGKAQPVDEPVLTPSGWRPIGDLRVGDEVISVDGKATRVIGVFPQGVRPVSVVEFSDGVRVRCDDDHLWSVRTDLNVLRRNPWRTMTTKELLRKGLHDGQRWRWRVPVVSRVEHPVAELPVHPYILGVLLGDGSLTNSGVRFTSADLEIVEEVSRCLPSDLMVSRTKLPNSAAWDCRIRAVRRGDKNPISNALTTTGLRARSENKHIPASYLSASADQRIAILQGLMDTDGSVEGGFPKFTTTSKQLADGVSDLVRSLGGVVAVWSKIPTYRHHGQKNGLRAYRVTINVEAPCFRLQRKLDAVMPRTRAPAPRKIVGIRKEGSAECVCIAVEHPSSFYVTTGYTVTHNSTFGHWLLRGQALTGVPVLGTALENRPIAAVQKHLRMEIGGDFLRVDAEQRRDALIRLGDMPLYLLDHYGHISAQQVITTIRYAVRRLGVRQVLIDHLGFLVPPDADDERRAIEAILRALAVTAYTIGVNILLVAHPKGLPPGQARPTMNDLKGASGIKQEASEVIIVETDPPRPNAKPPRPYPASIIHLDKVRSEFGIAGSSATLAFGPLSCTYADSWEETPEGMSGQLVMDPTAYA